MKLKTAAAIFFTAHISASLANESVVEKKSGDTVSEYEKLLIASSLYGTVRTHFAHWDGVLLDFDEEFKKYLLEIADSDDRLKFDMATLKLVSILNNSHTFFADDWLNKFSGPGFSLSKISGKWAVDESQVKGLELGSVVKSINGQPIEQFLEEKKRYVSASNESAAVSKIFSSGFLFPSEFKLTLDNKSEIDINDAAKDKSPKKPSDAIWKTLDNNIGYLSIPSFSAAKKNETIIEYIKNNADSIQSLIIDVRDNGGGSTPLTLIQSLILKPAYGFKFGYAQTSGLANFKKEGFAKPPLVIFDKSPVLPADNIFTKPIYLLINSGCASACEDFVSYMKGQPNVTTIGSVTYGSTGQPQVLKLAKDFTLIVGAKREYFSDGSKFEGVGISPDIEAVKTIQDLRRSNDPALKKAIALAGKI